MEDSKGTDSAGGTNAAIESSNSKQQHAVGGSKTGRAVNKGMNSKQIEKDRRHPNKIWPGYKAQG